MEKKEKAAEAAQKVDVANVQAQKDFAKLIEYFRYKTATTLDAMFDTGILRNSITWYVADAEKLGVLQAVKKGRDKRTGRMAKYYSSNPIFWKNKKEKSQLSFFGEEGGMTWG